MTTVIDSLVLTLGLDPKNFTKGQREALDAFKKTQEEAVKGGKSIEEQSKKSMEALGGIKTQSLQLFAAFTGAAGLVQFTTQAIHAGAAVGRLSRNLNVSVDSISRFQGLAKVFGGSAEGIAASFTSITDAVEGFKIGAITPLIGEFRALSAAGGTIIDVNKGVDATLLDIADNLRKIHDSGPDGPARAGLLGRRLGLDPGLFDAMIQKGETFRELLKNIVGLTDAEAEAAGRLERRWNSFTNNAIKAGQGFVLDQVNKTLNDINDPQNYIMRWLFGSLAPKDQPAATANAGGTSVATGAGAFTSKSEKEAFIRAEATAPGKKPINPDFAVAVARAEGFDKFLGDNGTSGGAFQLHVTPGGRGHAVGDEFRRKTGLDPLDPANERATIVFALDEARAHGWGAFHGAANTGIGPWAGIGGDSSSTTTSSVNINGPINVYPPPGADGTAIANKFTETLRRQSFGFQANGGQN